MAAAKTTRKRKRGRCDDVPALTLEQKQARRNAAFALFSQRDQPRIPTAAEIEKYIENPELCPQEQSRAFVRSLEHTTGVSPRILICASRMKYKYDYFVRRESLRLAFRCSPRLCVYANEWYHDDKVKVSDRREYMHVMSLAVRCMELLTARHALLCECLQNIVDYDSGNVYVANAWDNDGAMRDGHFKANVYQLPDGVHHHLSFPNRQQRENPEFGDTFESVDCPDSMIVVDSAIDKHNDHWRAHLLMGHTDFLMHRSKPVHVDLQYTHEQRQKTLEAATRSVKVALIESTPLPSVLADCIARMATGIYDLPFYMQELGEYEQRKAKLIEDARAKMLALIQ